MPGSVSSQNFGLTQNVRSVRFTFSYSNLYVMTNSVNEIPKARELVCTGVGKWLHTLPSHPILGEPQGLCWRMLTRNKLLMSWLSTISSDHKATHLICCEPLHEGSQVQSACPFALETKIPSCWWFSCHCCLSPLTSISQAGVTIFNIWCTVSNPSID